MAIDKKLQISGPQEIESEKRKRISEAKLRKAYFMDAANAVDGSGGKEESSKEQEPLPEEMLRVIGKLLSFVELAEDTL